jgi:hypothetical protein
MRSNPFVVGHLLGMMEPPVFGPSSYSLGDPSEAAVFAPDLKNLWEQTPGAMKWLETCPPPVGTARGKRAGGRSASRARCGLPVAL